MNGFISKIIKCKFTLTRNFVKAKLDWKNWEFKDNKYVILVKILIIKIGKSKW